MPDSLKAKRVRLSEDAWSKIDDYRWANRLPSETEALRQILDLGFKAAGLDKPKPS